MAKTSSIAMTPHRAPIITLMSLVTFALLWHQALASTHVLLLPLPQGASIADEGDRAQMGSGGDVVAATIQVDQVNRVAVWQGGNLRVLPIIKQYSTGGPDSQTLGAVTTSGKEYINAGYSFSGAYSGIKYHIIVFQGKSYHELRLPRCDLAGEPGDPLVDGANDGRLALTFESPNFIDLTKVDTSRYAPNAAIVASHRCEVVGRANILAIHGRYAAGFQGYLGLAIAPTNVQTDQQTSVAIRWVDHKAQRLGSGVAFDVNSLGQCVGSTVAPGYVGGSTYVGNGMVVQKSGFPIRVSPHAILWERNGTYVVLVPKFRSIAYAIDDGGRVVGTLEDSARHHFAFVWKAGALKRLDDLAGQSKWHFESAYGFTSDGGILGTGTHDGVAAAFIVHL